jgi:hypothetical protein
MVMHRYRFVEESLTIGRPETVRVRHQARRHVKLWNRVEVLADQVDEAATGMERFRDLLQKRKDDLMYSELDNS